MHDVVDLIRQFYVFSFLDCLEIDFSSSVVGFACFLTFNLVFRTAQVDSLSVSLLILYLLAQF